jgi:nitrite reductase/ring-hydroxylating ferredoxin subunit
MQQLLGTRREVGGGGAKVGLELVPVVQNVPSVPRVKKKSDCRERKLRKKSDSTPWPWVNEREMVITQEQNELLMKTGRGTPCGELMRRYWQPAALSSELAADKPLPATLFGEELILFRDGEGKPALIGRYCAHQGVDMIYGCVEPDGLRCMYHGWLFDNQGMVVLRGDWLPEKERRWNVGQPAYPVIEAGGVIFAFLGSGEPTSLPAEKFFTAPAADWALGKIDRSGNYLNVLGQIENESPNKVSFMLPNLLACQGSSSESPSWMRWYVPIDDSSHVEYTLSFAGELPFTGEPHASSHNILLKQAEAVCREQRAQSAEKKDPSSSSS